jgi:DNA-binding CsgD family transcriptional regulator
MVSGLTAPTGSRVAADRWAIVRTGSPGQGLETVQADTPAEDDLVGRDAAVEAVDRALAAVEEGRSRVLAITGEPGIGKSCLVRRVLDAVTARGWTALHGRGAEFERDVPYGIVVDALDPYFSACDDDELEALPAAALDGLADLVPALAARRAAGGAVARDDRLRHQHAVSRLVEALAADRPVAVVLDDVHWADEASIQVVRHLLRKPAAGPELVVLAFRPSAAPLALESALALAGREVDAIDLAPLTPEEVDRLLGDAVPPAQRARIARLSGGNPFYAVELGRHAGTALRRDRPGATSGGLEAVDVPAAVRFAIADELAHLTPDARLLAQGAAIAWEPFDLELAARVAGMDTDAAGRALDELLAVGVVRTVRDRQAFDQLVGGPRFRFRHPIVRHAVYTWAGEAWRIDAHARAAVVFEERGAPVGLLAHHVEHSAAYGDTAAIDLLAEAGASTLATAPAAAARWLRAALGLVAPTDGTRRLALLAPLLRALVAAGRADEARGAATEALELAADAGPAERADVACAVARLERLAGGERDVPGLLADALAVAPPGGDDAARLHAEVALAAWEAGDAAAARRYAAGAMEAGDRVVAALAQTVVALADGELGAIASAARNATEAGTIIDALDDGALAERLELAGLLALAEQALGRTADAERHLARGLALADASGQDALLLPLAAAQGLIEMDAGQARGAPRATGLAERAAALLSTPRARAIVAGLACLDRLREGDLDAAIRCGDELLGDGGPDVPFAAWRPLVALWVAEALLGSDRPEEALERLASPDAEAVGAPWRARAHALRAEAALAEGDRDRARAEASEAERVAAELELPAATADARLARAVVALDAGDARAAAAAAREAAATFRELGWGLAAARADALAGEALHAAGEREEATAVLEEALDAFTDAGAGRGQDRVARELRALGRRVGRFRAARGASGVASLTPREREIAERVMQGYTNRRVAAELYLSEKTVETHLSNVFGKLGVSSRVEVARVMAEEAAVRS